MIQKKTNKNQILVFNEAREIIQPLSPTKDACKRPLKVILKRIKNKCIILEGLLHPIKSKSKAKILGVHLICR